MSAEIVNLRRVRKAAERRRDEAAADQNRRLHGRTKAERDEVRRDREALKRALDQSRRETPPPPTRDTE